MSRSATFVAIVFLVAVVAAYAGVALFLMERPTGPSRVAKSSPCFDAEVARFHTDFNASNFDVLDSELIRTFRKASKSENKIWLARAREILGPVLDSRFHDQQQFRWGGEDFLECYYDTRFTAGPVSELFIWSAHVPRAVLRFYGILSIGKTPKIQNGPMPI